MSTPPGTPPGTPGSPVLLESPSPPAASPLPSAYQADSDDYPVEDWSPQYDSENATLVSTSADGSQLAYPAVLRLNNEDHTVTTERMEDNALQLNRGYNIPSLEVSAYQRDPASIISQSVLDDSSSLPPTETLNEDTRSNTGTSTQGSGVSDAVLQSAGSSHAVTVTVRNEDGNNMVSVPEISAVTKGVGRRSVSPGNEPPAKVRKVSNSSDEAEGDCCPVCLEPWGNAGDHHLVALKCGHLFGSSCVERWLRAAPGRERARPTRPTCPTCKARAAPRDVRRIYARRLVAADTAELGALRRTIEDLQAEKQRTELRLHQSQLATRACLEELEQLKARQGSPVAAAPAPRRAWRFALEKNLEMSSNGGCRVLAYNSRSYDLYVSQKSTSTLFPGWGVRKVSCVDLRAGQFQPLHPAAIRDAAYSPGRDALLTAGLDGCARVSNRGAAMLSLPGGGPLWACAWDQEREDQLYVGGVGGAVLQYDVRSPGQPLARLQAGGHTTPVVALQSTRRGLLACRLDCCFLWRPRAGAWLAEPLPVDGPFISMAYDPASDCALLSCRPRAGAARGRLVVCRLQDAGCSLEQTFPHSARSSVMCRAAWVTAGGQGTGGQGTGGQGTGGQARWAAAHTESEAALRLHPITGAPGVSLPAREPALDVRSVDLHGETLLAALSESRLRIYKAVATDP